MKYPKHTKKLLNSQVLILSRRLEQIFSQTIGYQKRFTKELLKPGIIDEKYVRELDAEWGAPAGCYEFDYAEEEGFQTKRMSTGQRGLAMLGKWLEENKEHWDEKTLLVFDEVDKGFDLSRQVGMSNMYRNLHKKFNVSILAVTHTLFPILAREEMFYFEFRKMVSSKFYCWMKTGYNITAEKLEENERKED